MLGSKRSRIWAITCLKIHFRENLQRTFSNLLSIDSVSRERSYATTAYYAAASESQNLHVLTNTTVEKILFTNSEAELRATGIQFQ